MATRTQEALYATIDLELSWSEAALPQAERTKHVHALHPYLGKFVPQLVEVFLDRYFAPGQCVLDPFAGSGTTLVEANARGLDAVGYDISAFNCLLARVKTRSYEHAKLESARSARSGAAAWRGRSADRYGLGAGVVRAARAGRAARLPRSGRGARRARARRGSRRPLTGCPLGEADDPLRSRLPEAAVP
jgi:hypothetical protein